MAYITLGQKAQRVVLLMLGMRHPPISRAMRKRGFTDAEMQKGFELLYNLSAGRYGQTDIEALSKPLLALDAWENLNYPIILAVLRHHYPAAYEVVFHKLSMTEGTDLIPSVNTLLVRLAAQPAEVHELLATRGVTPEVIAEARGYLTTLSSVVPTDDDYVDTEADEAAEKALWDWYLEWSTIARSVIKKRRHLRVLGFLQRSNGEVVDAPLPQSPADEDAPSQGGQTEGQVVTPRETDREEPTEREATRPREGETERTRPQQPVAPVVDPPPPGRNEPPPFE
jgi:hypothetical protein